MDYSNVYTVKYTKLFLTGNLKNVTVECIVSHPDLDHATRFMRALGGSSRVQKELITGNEYLALVSRIYAPGQLNEKGEVII